MAGTAQLGAGGPSSCRLLWVGIHVHVSQRDGFNSILKLLCGRAVQATEGWVYA